MQSLFLWARGMDYICAGFDSAKSQYFQAAAGGLIVFLFFNFYTVTLFCSAKEKRRSP